MKIGSGALRGMLLACALWQATAYGADAAAPSGETAAVSQDALRARALLEKAVAHYRQSKDEALVDFDRSREYVDGELYVYVVSSAGVMLASGGPSSALIDQDVRDLKDAAGKAFMREILEKANTKGAGTVQYRWLNRIDNKVELKVAYFQKIDDRIIAVGYYIARATPAQAEAMLGRAAAALAADAARTIEAINRTRGEFSQDDLYVFVIDLADKRFRAHGVNQRLVGTDALSLRDPDGRAIVEQMIDAVQERAKAGRPGPAEIDYRWVNPVTRRVEQKHTLLRKVGTLLVGVGYYTR